LDRVIIIIKTAKTPTTNTGDILIIHDQQRKSAYLLMISHVDFGRKAFLSIKKNGKLA